RHLTRVERVRIVVGNADAKNSVIRILKKCHADLAAVDFYLHRTDRSWIRDFGPIFVKKDPVKNASGEVAFTHWRFNGWAKYSNHRNDTRVPEMIGRKLVVGKSGMKHCAPDLVLEGGSIDVNGAGKLLTTEECLLSDVQARNPGLSQ